MELKFRNVNEAFRELVQLFHKGNCLHDHENPNRDPWRGSAMTSVRRNPSRNGDVLLIDEPILITYSHPRERVLFNSARDANPFFGLYEQLWMLAGRRDVKSVAYYVKRMMEFSDDGETLNGSAYGYRWRRAHIAEHLDLVPESVLNQHAGGFQGYWSEHDQLDIIVNHLKADPHSRRAVLTMWNVEDDLLKIGIRETTDTKEEPNKMWKTFDPPSKDVCCNLSVMFAMRRERLESKSVRDQLDCNQGEKSYRDYNFLDMTVTNRSNDLVLGMLGSDYLTFTFLQEYMACRLGVEVGRYNHFSNNLHVYVKNWKPEEWLAEETKTLDGYQSMRFLGAEEPGMFKSVPLVKNPEVFDREVKQFVEQYGNPEEMEIPFRQYTEPFLKTVAQPMMDAHLTYKLKGTTALDHAGRIAADDWRIAATNWLQRRVKK